MQVDTLIHAAWVIPVEPHGTVLSDHAVALKDGRIHGLCPSSEASRQYRADIEVRLGQHALIPGLVNAHGHAAMTLMRGLADDLHLMDWLKQHIWPAESRWVGAEFVHDGSRLACAEMLRSGTTCFNDMYFFAEETAHAAAQAGMRAVIGMIVVDFPSAWAQDADEYITRGLELHDQFRNNTHIFTAFAPHAPYTVSDAPLQRVATLAEELDVQVHMHVHESATEIEESLAQYGKRPLQRLDELGLLGPRLLGVHMTQLADTDIAQYASRGAHVVHCAESNLKLASGFCPVETLARAGINVALGTDSAASNNDLDMFAEMRSAALLAKAVAADASAMPAATALRMATLNGARALGLEDLVGSIEPGKAADLVAVDLGGIETQPVYNPVSQLVYAAARDKVSDVWIAGRHLVKDQQLTTLDTDELLHKTRDWGARIADWHNARGKDNE